MENVLKITQHLREASSRYTSVPDAPLECSWSLLKTQDHCLVCLGAIEGVGRGKVEGPLVGFLPPENTCDFLVQQDGMCYCLCGTIER